MAGDSASELQMLWILALDLRMADRHELTRAWNLTIQERKMIARFVKRLRTHA